MLLFFASRAFCSINTDYSLECNPGYRLASFRRFPAVNNVVGSLAVECELIEPDPQQVTCGRLESVPQCSGIFEGCSGNSWIGGFHAYIIENTTEAVLLEPICCSSTNIVIDETSCIRDRINRPREKFNHGIAEDLVYRGIQCWHQYDNDHVLFDLIWKLELCSFVSPFPSKRRKECRECDCRCGIDRCTDFRYPIRIVHKHHMETSCGCRCDCAFKCL